MLQLLQLVDCKLEFHFCIPCSIQSEDHHHIWQPNSLKSSSSSFWPLKKWEWGVGGCEGTGKVIDAEHTAAPRLANLLPQTYCTAVRRKHVVLLCVASLLHCCAGGATASSYWSTILHCIEPCYTEVQSSSPICGLWIVVKKHKLHCHCHCKFHDKTVASNTVLHLVLFCLVMCWSALLCSLSGFAPECALYVRNSASQQLHFSGCGWVGEKYTVRYTVCIHSIRCIGCILNSIH